MKRINRIILHAAACLILASAVTMTHADTLQVPQLMHMLAQNKSGKATFVEKKYIGILDRPVVSTGTLSFVAPNQLEKRTLTPKSETLVLNGDTLTIDRSGGQQEIVSLGDHPEITAFIESIRGTLAGDLAALRTYYTLELSGTADQWSLALTPKQKRLSAIFTRIRIGGSGADVETIELDQHDGDRSVMTITGAGVIQ